MKCLSITCPSVRCRCNVDEKYQFRSLSMKCTNSLKISNMSIINKNILIVLKIRGKITNSQESEEHFKLHSTHFTGPSLYCTHFTVLSLYCPRFYRVRTFVNCTWARVTLMYQLQFRSVCIVLIFNRHFLSMKKKTLNL